MIPISIIQVIDARRQELKMKKAELARAGGMRPANVRTLFSKKKPNPDLVTLYRLMTPLGLRWECSDATDERGLIAFFDARRQARGWSESQLAEFAGVDVSNLKRLFASEAPRPRLRTLLDLADALGLSMRLIPRSDAHNNEASRSALEVSGDDSRSSEHWFDRMLREWVAKDRQAKAEKKRRDREANAKLLKQLGLISGEVSASAPGSESEHDDGGQPSDAADTAHDAGDHAASGERTEDSTSDDEATSPDDDDEFQDPRKRWPNDNKWTGAGGESQSGPDQGDESDTDDAPEPESVEWDVIFDEEPPDPTEEPPDPTDEPGVRWHVTLGGAVVLGVVFCATAVSGFFVMRKVRMPAILRSVPIYKDWRFWCCLIVGGVGVGVSLRSKNQTVRQVGTAAFSGLLAGTVAGGVFSEHQRRAGLQEPEV